MILFRDSLKNPSTNKIMHSNQLLVSFSKLLCLIIDYCSCLSGLSSFWLDIQRVSYDPQPWASRTFLSNLAVSSWAAFCRSYISVVTPAFSRWLDNDFPISFQARQTSRRPQQWKLSTVVLVLFPGLHILLLLLSDAIHEICQRILCLVSGP